MLGIQKKSLGFITIGTFILAAGLYNIHQQFAISEGGVLGAILLIHHWTNLPASLLSIALDVACYALALKILGWDFIKKSMVASLLMMFFLAVFEQFPPVLTPLITNRLMATILGGLFVGVGVGVVIRYGGSCGGDDAIALIISQKLKLPLKFSYMFTDFLVLGLSLSYIPLTQIAYSLITVTVSSLTIDIISNYKEEVVYENKSL